MLVTDSTESLRGGFNVGSSRAATHNENGTETTDWLSYDIARLSSI